MTLTELNERRLTWEVEESHHFDDEWMVETCDMDDEGQYHIAVFSGRLSEELAEEYAAWKNRGSS